MTPVRAELEATVRRLAGACSARSTATSSRPTTTPTDTPETVNYDNVLDCVKVCDGVIREIAAPPGGDLESAASA